MPKIDYRRIYVVFFALVIAALSCGNPPEDTSPISSTAKESQEAGQFACDGTPYLIVTGEITSQGTNQFGTRSCEYVLKIRNNYPGEAMSFYIYQHEKDGYAHTEKSRWMGNILLESGQEAIWEGSIYIYDDQDADGPLMSIPEKISGVLNVQECSDEKQNEQFFELISIPLEMVCPME